MSFGQHLRELRRNRNLGQKALAAMVGLSHTYLSKVENERLDFAQYPSEDAILKLAQALEVDGDELLLLAQKVPPGIRSRIMQRPEAFLAFSRLSDSEIDDLLVEVNNKKPRSG
jgi:transcriptional regulator with XRE-family HTH domain